MEAMAGYELNGQFRCLPLGGNSSLVILRAVVPGPGNGPWAMLFDEVPESGGRGVGPAPVLAALGGLAA